MSEAERSLQMGSESVSDAGPDSLLSGSDSTEESGSYTMTVVKNVAIIGGVGLLTFIATPVVSGAAMTLVGIEAGSAAAGACGAAVMSASAAASGSGTVAGGVVATLQSAGAVGVGSGVSALAGSIASGTAALVKYRIWK